MGIRESKTASCDRCPEETTWEKNYSRAIALAPDGWAWVSVHPEPGGPAKRALLCVECVEALDDFIHALKP